METQDVKKEFKKRKKRQMIISFSLIPLIFLMLFLANHPENNFTGLSREALFYGFTGIFIIGFVLSLLNWRCPSCRKYLGKQFNPKFCPKCGAELQ